MTQALADGASPITLLSPADQQEALSRLMQLATADLERESFRGSAPDQGVERLASLGHRLIPRTDGCVIAVVALAGSSPASTPIQVVAQTDPRAAGALQAEVALGNGPARDVAGRRRSVRIDDARIEPRWPLLCRRLVQSDVLSMAVCGVPVTQRSSGILLIVSSHPLAFVGVGESLLPAFADRVRVELAHRDIVQNLSAAITSRQLVGQAVGILMERHRIDADVAFSRLVRASQRFNVKVHVIAERVVRTGQEPDNVFR